MTPEISEFSYGFSLTNEIVGWAQLKTAPIFPSLIEEGKAGGGYDVRLDMPGVPLFLQFKRADCMVRRTAAEISVHTLSMAVPFYRFKITESGKSDQHSLLLELDDGQNDVFYAAPRFHEIAEINQAWSSREIASRSIFIRPSAIGALDHRSHHIAYDHRHAYLFSTPRPVEFLSAANLVEKLSNRLKVEERPLRDAVKELSVRAVNARLRANTSAKTATSEKGAVFGSVLDDPRTLPIPPLEEAEQVPTRLAKPLSGPLQDLRQLADDAIKIFDAQLVIVQSAD
jgi:hypothetical protein